MKTPAIAALLLVTLTGCSSLPFAPAGKALAPEDCLALEFPNAQDPSNLGGIAAISQFAVEALIDASEEDAIECATQMGLESRIVKRDGQSFAVTMDYSPTRVNLSIDRGIVKEVSIG